MVGVSSDSVESHDRWSEAECLPFALASDVGGRIRELYGVPRSFFNLVPGRMTFVISRDRVVRRVFSSHIAFRKHADTARDELAEIVSRGDQGSQQPAS